ncbi:AbrB/MazE/SpoVT family DNA-binding domain-containing protein [Methylobacterium sp. WL120]|uniref:AbrB/MazE/SpoVT family DNA-binding domain-containing protein n=1 Tax=Methylobacterium sp. WL120 TaxID=2603887 RepID=UPI0011C829C2|nr:AbrB/MazE/SpoVT family DNA-binding domain-containing protein [Methylobacterium sp. WL120]TXM63944.1 AbrB/MazE/SpoVT family DNA-binding domain-containing protein [Methylobacterium sp. WL120]
MVALKLTQIGDAVGVVLPKEVQARLNVSTGDTVFLVETPDGYHLTLETPDFADQMAVARAVMKDRRDALRELAK